MVVGPGESTRKVGNEREAFGSISRARGLSK